VLAGSPAEYHTHPEFLRQFSNLSIQFSPVIREALSQTRIRFRVLAIPRHANRRCITQKPTGNSTNGFTSSNRNRVADLDQMGIATINANAINGKKIRA